MEKEMLNTNMRQSKPAALPLREGSHSISKPKPKIRIVHIFTPEIIKTDAANFRELVQRLTGKPANRYGGGTKKKVKVRQVIKRELEEEEEERGMWRVEETSGGFLSGLGDFDGFFQGFSDFSVLPLSSSSHMDRLIGGAQVI